MRNIICVVLCLILVSAGFWSSAEETAGQRQVSDLELVITGLTQDGGKLKVGLYNTKESYESRKIPLFRSCRPDVEDLAAGCVFDDIPYGEYAVKFYHDKNGNGKLDTNFFKIPTETYGFSNNVRGTLGPASYSDAKFTINAPKVTHTISLE